MKDSHDDKDIEVYWLSTNNITFSVEVKNGIVIETAPVARKFVNQPFSNLLDWLREQGELNIKRL